MRVLVRWRALRPLLLPLTTGGPTPVSSPPFLSLSLLSRSTSPLSELRVPFERYATSGEINTKVEDQQAVIEKVAAHFAEAPVDTRRADDRPGGCGSTSGPSNTEPLLRLNLEAADAATCDAKTTEVLDLIRS